MMPNRPALGDLLVMEPSAIAALPTDVLAILASEAAATVAHANAIQDRLDGALDLKFGSRAAAARRAQGKDVGTVRFDDGDFVVIADLPKRVRWDQAQLAAIVDRIRAAGEDPAEYVATERKVSERVYGAWPESIRAAFAPARTVQPGKPVYRIEQKENR